jgi:hypothetical protein
LSYQVVFDVSERLPQLVVGVVAAAALAIVIVAGLWDTDALLRWWALVLGFGAACVGLQWLIGGQWPYLLGGAVVIAVIVLLERAGQQRADLARRLPRGAGSLMAGLFLLVLATGQGLPMVRAIDLNQRLLDGQATIVEGPVTVEPGLKSECLVVDAQRFCYSESTISPGYNRQRYLIGGLETGRQVRLSVIDGLIVRLEVGSPG